ncbi:MAG: hypothetical protein M3394_01090 [Actinomycetota bacterium]|nr:hypothetical protein [Actinomycetota bacterium]
MASASDALSKETVAAKSVVTNQCRSAAANAGRSAVGLRRPTSNSACGIERPSAPTCNRMSSTM